MVFNVYLQEFILQKRQPSQPREKIEDIPNLTEFKVDMLKM